MNAQVEASILYFDQKSKVVQACGRNKEAVKQKSNKINGSTYQLPPPPKKALSANLLLLLIGVATHK